MMFKVLKLPKIFMVIFFSIVSLFANVFSMEEKREPAKTHLTKMDWAKIGISSVAIAWFAPAALGTYHAIQYNTNNFFMTPTALMFDCLDGVIDRVNLLDSVMDKLRGCGGFSQRSMLLGFIGFTSFMISIASGTYLYKKLLSSKIKKTTGVDQNLDIP